MKTINNFILERLKLNNDSKIKDNSMFHINTTKKDIILDIEKSEDEHKNECFKWICNHMNINLDALAYLDPTSRHYDSSRLKVDWFVKKTDKYAINTYFISCVVPNDINLIPGSSYLPLALIEKYYNHLENEFKGYFGKYGTRRLGRSGHLYFIPKTGNNWETTGGLGVIYTYQNFDEGIVPIQKNIVNNQ